MLKKAAVQPLGDSTMTSSVSSHDVAREPRVTKKIAATQLGVNVKAVDRMIALGELKIVSIPGGVRAIVLQSSVDSILARMRGQTLASV